MLASKAITARSFAKVPEVTLGFWIIKIAATTLGETLGDFLSKGSEHGGINLGFPENS